MNKGEERGQPLWAGRWFGFVAVAVTSGFSQTKLNG